MTIDFNLMEENAMESFCGGDGVFCAKIFNDGANKILKGTLKTGCSIGLHCHETSSEIIYVLEGEGEMLCEGEPEILRAGDCHYCKKGESHSFRNKNEKDLVFFAVVPQQ